MSVLPLLPCAGRKRLQGSGTTGTTARPHTISPTECKRVRSLQGPDQPPPLFHARIHSCIGKDSRPRRRYYRVGMEPNDREYIARMAEKERQVRGLDEGDHVTVSARFGEFAGRVEEVKPADAGEGNYVVIIDAAVYNGQAQGADTHTVTIDYEGAFTSEYSYYVPYIVATADDVALHDVKELKIEKDAPKVRQ